jgi:hypothetical protein
MINHNAIALNSLSFATLLLFPVLLPIVVKYFFAFIDLALRFCGLSFL